MTEKLDLERDLEYFISTHGSPSAVLNRIAAAVAEVACDREDCNISSANVSTIPTDPNYKRRERLVNCYTCRNEAIICRTFDKPLNPSVAEVDDGVFLRQEAFQGLHKFYATIDGICTPKEILDRSRREEVAVVIRENY